MKVFKKVILVVAVLALAPTWAIAEGESEATCAEVADSQKKAPVVDQVVTAEVVQQPTAGSAKQAPEKSKK